MANQALLKLMQEEMKMGLKGGLYHQVQIKLAYNSNRIEGSRLSEDQTRYIFETNTLHMDPEETANVDDIMETVNHFVCFDYMLAQGQEDLSEEMVGDMKTTAPGKVAAAMEKLLASGIEKRRSGARDRLV